MGRRRLAGRAGMGWFHGEGIMKDWFWRDTQKDSWLINDSWGWEMDAIWNSLYQIQLKFGCDMNVEFLMSQLRWKYLKGFVDFVSLSLCVCRICLLSKKGLRYLLYPFISFWMVGGKISPSFTSALSSGSSRMLLAHRQTKWRESKKETKSFCLFFFWCDSWGLQLLLNYATLVEQWSDDESTVTNREQNHISHTNREQKIKASKATLNEKRVWEWQHSCVREREMSI